jgi:pimeloyl-ACP methyl ester carboxylesterase
MNGLLGELFTDAMNKIGEKLRMRGAIVEVGSWMQASTFVADACEHRQDRIIFIGHSLGAAAAATAATEAKACGARHVTMIGIDPPPIGSTVQGGARAVNFVGALNGSIVGAHNVTVSGLGHIGIVNDQTMQNRVVSTALR